VKIGLTRGVASLEGVEFSSIVLS